MAAFLFLVTVYVVGIYRNELYGRWKMKQFRDKIMYETGEEERGAEGRVCGRWTVLYTPSEEIAFREYRKFGRNYIRRHIPAEGGRRTEEWNFETREWDEKGG